MRDLVKLHPRPPLSTGQRHCYDVDGSRIPCAGTGHDGMFRLGVAAPEQRFHALDGHVVLDRLTGLMWTEDANPAQLPVSWQEAFEFVRDMNRRRAYGYGDWRVPNRRELRSLVDHEVKRPVLPGGHPFRGVFHGWYWTSTTSALNTGYAWYIHMEGARMFYGRKDQYCLLWPVRGEGNGVVHATGQTECFDSEGEPMPCAGTGQDGELHMGAPWPSPRFVRFPDTVRDMLTGLLWTADAGLAEKPVVWKQALELVRRLNDREFGGRTDWRLPNINELESLVDCSAAAPALSKDHPFVSVQDVYWSSTTSYFETDWAWALYLDKGAIGVGYKREAGFRVWPVAGGAGPEP